MAIVDIAAGELCCRAQCRVGIGDLVMLLEARLQAFEDLEGLLDRRLLDIDLLEAPSQRPILLEDAAILLIGRRADATQVARRQHGLDQVGGVHHAARGRPGTDDGVDLVDEQDRVALPLELCEHRLEALLEVAAILGPGDQTAEVQRVDHGVAQDLRNLGVHDLLGQAFGNGGLAHTGLADEQRIVLAPPAEDLDGALDLEVAPDQRIDPALASHLVEIGGEAFQRAVAFASARRAPPRPRPAPRLPLSPGTLEMPCEM
jgi:hypothetical protein